MIPAQSSLKKTEILRGYRAFSRVLSEGRMFQRGAVRCFVLRETNMQRALRAGFSVSRSVGRAADRNRVRRWMKEAYRRNKPGPGLPPPQSGMVMIVFLCTTLVTAGSGRTTYTTIEQSIISLLRELHRQLSEQP